MNRETAIQIALCVYVSLKYPKELFTSDLGGVRLTMKQAKTASKMRKRRGHPDWTLYAQRGGKCGLMLELKAEGVAVFKQIGSMRKNPHFEEQAAYMNLLTKQGWVCRFAQGLDEAIKIVDSYMAGKL